MITSFYSIGKFYYVGNNILIWIWIIDLIKDVTHISVEIQESHTTLPPTSALYSPKPIIQKWKISTPKK
jgi:fucose permease